MDEFDRIDDVDIASIECEWRRLGTLATLGVLAALKALGLHSSPHDSVAPACDADLEFCALAARCFEMPRGVSRGTSRR